MFETYGEKIYKSTNVALIAAIGFAGIANAQEPNQVKTIQTQNSVSLELPAPAIANPATPDNITFDVSGNKFISDKKTGKKNLNFNKITEVPQKIIDTNAAYIPTLGCSGYIIRDPVSTKPIGVATSEHCHLRDNNMTGDMRRIIGSDGNNYISPNTPLEVMVGSKANTMKTVGIIRELYLIRSGDNSVDVALGTFLDKSSNGQKHPVDQVIDAYNNSRLTDSEIGNLKPGVNVYLSGWPQAQPNKAPWKPWERQDFVLKILGVDNTLIWPYSLLWTAAHKTNDGAVCSFGDSGGQGFVMEDGKPHSLGVLGAFYDFTGSLFEGSNGMFSYSQKEMDDWRLTLESLFKTSLSGFDAVCGFAYQTPYQLGTGTYVEVSNHYADIPGYKDNLIYNSRKDFFDEKISETVLDASIDIGTAGKPDWIYKPIIFNDSISNSMVVGYYSKDAIDGLKLVYVSSHILFGKGTWYSTSGLKYPFQGESIDSFIDQNGLTFGQEYGRASPPNSDNKYLLAYYP